MRKTILTTSVCDHLKSNHGKFLHNSCISGESVANGGRSSSGNEKGIAMEWRYASQISLLTHYDKCV